MLTRSKARLSAKAKRPLGTKVTEYCDGNCGQLAIGKKQISHQKDKESTAAQIHMPTSPTPTDTTGSVQIEDEPSAATTTTAMALTFDDVAKLLGQQSEKHADQWQQQLHALAKTFEKSQTTVPFSGSSNIKFPTFSGDPSEDVNSFLRQFNLTAAFYKLNNSQKADMLPLLLTGNANVWFSAATLSGKSYDQLCEALKKQFHTESDIWLLRQQLLNRKQLPNETVAQFAFEIRKLCQRLDLSAEESVNSLLNGLRPELKNYVILQRPKTFSEAETHAKLREALPDEKPKDRTDEILSALAKLKSTEEPKIAAYNAPFTNSNTPRVGYSQEKPLGREEITQIIRQELRRSRTQQTQGQDYRNRRSLDGRPICNYCKKAGHIAYVCRKRQFDQRDPRIPQAPNRPTGQNTRFGEGQARPAPFQRRPLN